MTLPQENLDQVCMVLGICKGCTPFLEEPPEPLVRFPKGFLIAAKCPHQCPSVPPVAYVACSVPLRRLALCARHDVWAE